MVDVRSDPRYLYVMETTPATETPEPCPNGGADPFCCCEACEAWEGPTAEELDDYVAGVTGAR